MTSPIRDFNHTQQTLSFKIIWTGVVCLSFLGAGLLIGKSYKEWQESPVATSITTRPINGLDFPIVTICPPKGSNTALYHDLVSVGNGSLSEKERRALKESASKIFVVIRQLSRTSVPASMMRKSLKDGIKSTTCPSEFSKRRCPCCARRRRHCLW